MILPSPAAVGADVAVGGGVITGAAVDRPLRTVLPHLPLQRLVLSSDQKDLNHFTFEAISIMNQFDYRS